MKLPIVSARATASDSNERAAPSRHAGEAAGVRPTRRRARGSGWLGLRVLCGHGGLQSGSARPRQVRPSRAADPAGDGVHVVGEVVADGPVGWLVGSTELTVLDDVAAVRSPLASSRQVAKGEPERHLVEDPSVGRRVGQCELAVARRDPPELLSECLDAETLDRTGSPGRAGSRHPHREPPGVADVHVGQSGEPIPEPVVEQDDAHVERLGAWLPRSLPSASRSSSIIDVS